MGYSEQDLSLMILLGLDYEPKLDISRLLSQKFSFYLWQNSQWGDQRAVVVEKTIFDFLR
jgi:hypothetical protein